MAQAKERKTVAEATTKIKGESVNLYMFTRKQIRGMPPPVYGWLRDQLNVNDPVIFGILRGD